MGTSLDISTNNISMLPKDITLCKKLQSVNISVNSFVVFPYLLLELEELSEIKATKNFIADVDVEALESHVNLEEVNLEGNPLTKRSYDNLHQVLRIKIFLSEKKYEEWEDLSI